MSSVNKVILIGNTGKDPEVKTFESGVKTASITLATSERYKDRSGQQQEKTEWHNVVVFGKLVDVVEKYVKKGDKLYIEGSITTRKWQDREGNDRYTTEIKCLTLTMLGGVEKKATQPVVAVGDDKDDSLPF